MSLVVVAEALVAEMNSIIGAIAVMAGAVARARRIAVGRGDMNGLFLREDR